LKPALVVLKDIVMSFQFYSNMISQASKRIAGGIFATGFSLIAFGVLIFLLPVLFAAIAAIIFCVIGLGACVTAIKIFIVQRTIDKQMHQEDDDSDDHRRNVRIKIE
jgi:glucan phosphoethanolaminetransferase (alkaline phosphatase superfamily)